MRGGSFAFKGIEQAAACQRCGCGALAGAGYGEGIGNVQMEGCGVAIGGIVGEREPSGGEEEIGVFVADDGGADTGYGTIFFVGQQALIGEGQSDVATGSDGRWQRYEDV